jgi:ABC-type Zn uptake system ZnuABC Zn-binding protein ZnuA
VVSIGSGLEPGVPLDDVDAPQWALTENAGGLLAFEEAGAHEEEELAPEHEDEAGDEGGGDPHVWMDPTRTATALPSLAGALADVDPANADEYRHQADRYAAELERLDSELRSTLDSVPAANRELITSHDSLGYFADRYDFDVVATAFPASGPEAEASAGELREVTDAVRESEAPAVFAQQDDDAEVLRQIADEAGVEIEEQLEIESPAEGSTYVEMLRRDAELIAAALG